MKLNISQIRADFPILNTTVNKKPLVYFDNAATTQKPNSVIQKISHYYQSLNSNVHRGNHYLSQAATEEFENARTIVKDFIKAKHSHEIIFTRGTTESINLVASSFGKKFLGENDEVIISGMEHHSNIVPWQLACEDKKARLKVIPVNDHGEIIFTDFIDLVTSKTKIISIAHVSNTLGTINPIHKIIRYAHQRNIPVLIDGAQAAPHTPIDVQALDAEFYCFSGHKTYGPTGIGVLYGKEEWLNKLPPYQGGGEMIESVSFENTTFNKLPFKFEAGTPNIAGAIALGSALDYISNIGLENISEYENALLTYATRLLSEIKGMNIIGTAQNKASVISFTVDGTHPGDLGVLLDKMGVAIRVGNHCTEPLMKRFKVSGTARASFSFYNTFEEIDYFVESLNKAIEMLI